MTRFMIAAVLMLIGLPVVFGQTSQSRPATGSQPMSREEMVKQYLGLQQEMAKLFQEKDFKKAAETCEEFIRLFPHLPVGYYNLACAQARLGLTKEAIASLRKAVAAGYDEADHMAGDPDLASLAGDKEFKEVVELAQKAGQKWFKYDEMPGIKTLTGSPKDGLPYRVRMSPTATKDKPNKLIIWLHPSGGSANEYVESMADMFIKHGYALVVFPKKNFAYWTAMDVQMLTKSINDLEHVEGIDISKAILMGFSAGGQASLEIYKQNASKLGGMILDAAYPMTMASQTQYTVLMPPDTPAVADVPILVFVGMKDGLVDVWHKAEPRWLAKNVPLTVVYVPGAAHAWMLGSKQPGNRAVLDKWLEAVSQGKKPTSQPASGPCSGPASAPASAPANSDSH